MAKHRKSRPKKIERIIAFRRITAIIDHLSTERGLQAEEKVKRIFCKERKATWPVWLYGVRKGYEEEDHHGIDFVARTDIGDIFIQIKSSESGALNFKNHPKYNPLTALVVIKARDDEKVVSTKVISTLSRKRMLMKNV